MKKIFSILLLLVLFCGLFAEETITFHLPDNETLNSNLDEFTFCYIQSAPSSLLNQDLWADGYIGQIFDLPPHLGGGFSTGIASLDMKNLILVFKELDQFGILDTLDENKKFVLPSFTADVKIGGIGFPFDLGIHGMAIQPMALELQDILTLGVDFSTVGASLRIPIIKQGLVLPCISIGLGYDYAQGNLSTLFNKDIEYNSQTVNMNMDVGAGYEIQTLTLTAQISKKIVFITPFGGIRGSISSYKRNWDWSYNISASGDGADIAQILGIATAATDSNEYSDSEWSGFKFDDTGIFTAQVYAGVGLDFLVLGQFSISGSYDIVNNIWGAGASLKIKL